MGKVILLFAILYLIIESSISFFLEHNNRFAFDSPTQLKEGFQAALIKGLPYPILTVAEYLSVDAEGFCWGRNYRYAIAEVLIQRKRMLKVAECKICFLYLFE